MAEEILPVSSRSGAEEAWHEKKSQRSEVAHDEESHAPCSRNDGIWQRCFKRKRRRKSRDEGLDGAHEEPSLWRPVVRKTRRAFAPGGTMRPFRLLRQDWRNLAHRYASDWGTFNQLIFASAVFVFFTNLLPGITFASDLYVLTGKNWGTIEVVLSTGLCGIIFSIFSIQPLTILGVTGPFSILAENIYSLCESSFHIPFLPFMTWSLLHAAWMHFLLAIFNAHSWTMHYVTTFSTEIFSLLNSIIYFHKAIQELQRVHAGSSFAAFLYSIIGTIGTFFLAVFLSTAEHWRPLFHRYIRMGLAEYAAAISIIFFIGMPHVGELASLDFQTLQVSTSFRPTSPERTRFFVEFWHLPLSWIFTAIIPGFIITLLFFFDHEVSSIICTIERYGTKKPGGFAWDIVLLGITTAMCGILGIPPANGLLPQAPLHSESLMHTEVEHVRVVAEDGEEKVETREVRRVHEQRWSAFLHAGGIILFVSPPFMHVLGLTPTSVLAGLFLFMGEQSLSVNPILYRFFYMLTPPSELPPLPETLLNRNNASINTPHDLPSNTHLPPLPSSTISPSSENPEHPENPTYPECPENPEYPTYPPHPNLANHTPTSPHDELEYTARRQPSHYSSSRSAHHLSLYSTTSRPSTVSSNPNPGLASTSVSTSTSTPSPNTNTATTTTVNTLSAYLPIHMYTLTQILVTAGIFIVTLTKGAPAFPIIIIALVPVRLLVMKYCWHREVLRYVDAWACKDGTPEDDEDVKRGMATVPPDGVSRDG
ncbi:hypothetical protein L228DRAFT_283061 [Xylona heveae TC161]|uniref:Bicarbonate transporter-like transmembrane domain-containing protein n=1 Tax=Xylona heveae (strain CBS 132557 / TC161) TaxID=1328760 RepID=A0A165H581_XYLHT|nr:hypothetical protein L228DRAFT_283061 [Xylona heveae TC161]KZF23001.1 hypothetical protein L228DRAFT_283061 [Xylona heveae TC161]